MNAAFGPFGARRRYVVGPDGSPLTIADLPSPKTRRWVVRRKGEVVAAVRGGLLSLGEACERYDLSIDEFLVWNRQIERYGLGGLRATKLKDYRSSDHGEGLNGSNLAPTDQLNVVAGSRDQLWIAGESKGMPKLISREATGER
jgi:hypothetical protein